MSALIARVELPIRVPARDVWRAFVEPEMLTRFWLSSASGPLALGTTVRWSSRRRRGGRDDHYHLGG